MPAKQTKLTMQDRAAEARRERVRAAEVKLGDIEKALVHALAILPGLVREITSIRAEMTAAITIPEEEQ